MFSLFCVQTANIFIDILKAVVLFMFLRATADTAIAHLSHRNSVRPSVRHTGGSVKNGAR